MEPSLNIRSFRIGNLVYNPHLERIGYIAEITRADMTLFHGEMLIKEAGFYHEILDKVVLGDVRPIRLTPTLLEKCGFEKEFSDCYQRFDYYIIPRVICLSPKKEGFFVGIHNGLALLLCRIDGVYEPFAGCRDRESVLCHHIGIYRDDPFLVPYREADGRLRRGKVPGSGEIGLWRLFKRRHVVFGSSAHIEYIYRSAFG